MLFNSFQFLWLFPLVFLAYYGVGRIIDSKTHGRGSNLLLLCMSYALYMQWNAFYSLILLGVTAVTYLGALALDKWRNYRSMVVWGCVVLAILPLLLFKYYNFVIDNINSLTEGVELQGLNWAIPLGISFFTFQAVGYLVDVYKGRIVAEKNFLDYALFVAFFPQILSGPISKASELMPQIKARRQFDYRKAVEGLKWLLWGMFLKTVLADRLGLYVDTVFNNYQFQSGISLFVASWMYTLQIYGDFAGYSLMAIGVGRLMGFDLINNFNRPYFASSITEFWKRWHISLTRWLTTYIYIGMGGNRCSRLRQYFNIMVTFLVSGIWHGANWTFILWGLMHGLLQCMEKALGLDPKGSWKDSVVLKRLKPLRIVLTFSLVNIAWILFRLPTLDAVQVVFTKMVEMRSTRLFLPSNSSMAFMAIAIAIVFAKELCEEYFPKVQVFNHSCRIVRWTAYCLIAVIIMLTGVFDAGQFIYVQF